MAVTFGGVRVAHILMFLYYVVLCLLCPPLPAPLDCPFLIATSVFPNVCLQDHILFYSKTCQREY